MVHTLGKVPSFDAVPTVGVELLNNSGTVYICFHGVVIAGAYAHNIRQSVLVLPVPLLSLLCFSFCGLGLVLTSLSSGSSLLLPSLFLLRRNTPGGRTVGIRSPRNSTSRNFHILVVLSVRPKTNGVFRVG